MSLSSGPVTLRPGFLILLGAGACFGSVDLLALFLGAAAVHELGHLLGARLAGVHLSGLVLSAQGAELTLGPEETSFVQDILLCLSGPAANLALAAGCAFWRVGPAFLGANLLLCAFNLLPIRPLDGGNALYALLSCFCSLDTVTRVTDLLSLVLALGTVGLGIWCLLAPGGRPWLLLLGIWLSLMALRREG